MHLKALQSNVIGPAQFYQNLDYGDLIFYTNVATNSIEYARVLTPLTRGYYVIDKEVLGNQVNAHSFLKE